MDASHHLILLAGGLGLLSIFAGHPRADRCGSCGHGPLLEPTFTVVVISLVVQGWTIGPAARLLGFGASPANPSHVRAV